MIESVLPIVSFGEHSNVVLKVREHLNLLGDDLLDAPLAELIRGVQSAKHLPVTGDLDYATLRVIGIEP